MWEDIVDLAERHLLIDGKLVEAHGGRTFANINPATEEELGPAPDGAKADMDAAIAAARRAFDETGWGTDVALRVRCLRQLHQSLQKHAEELRTLTVAEVGSPVALTYAAQLDTPLSGVEWVADLAERYEWRTDLGQAEPFGMPSRRYVWREPVGVVGAITPWNYPNQINLAKVVPALAAGNTVVLKPAPDTPWTGLVLGRLMAEETDIPPGVVNVVTSSDHQLGQQLAEDPRVDMVSFTGSTATGRKVMTAAAATIKKVFLELGGKSAFVALDDADLSSTGVGVAFQVTSHAGQGCAITSRYLLPRSRYEEGLEALVGAIKTIPYGDPTDPGNLMGPLISERQRSRVLGYIEKGREEGARVLLGGGVPSHLPRGFYVEPTILADVDPTATVAQEEIFGPVLVVLAYEDDDDAVSVANNSIYGLSGAVYSASNQRARAVAARLRTGTSGVNGGVWFGPDVPFGGYKQSGVGREMGVPGFEEYLETKAVAEGA
ncbi:MAG TPA: aldehyde dehydrogenase [Acidimicrobiales bacterium]|nr:aldehyde dehydrogenase [Acidimicrobiales bacterium]